MKTKKGNVSRRHRQDRWHRDELWERDHVPRCHWEDGGDEEMKKNNQKKKNHALGDQDSVPAKHKFVPEVMFPFDRNREREQGDAEAQYNGNEEKKKKSRHTEKPKIVTLRHDSSNLKVTPGPKRELTLEEEEEEQEEQEKFHRFLSFFSQLDDSERDIIRLRFGLDGKRPKTLAEVGELFHLSPERIRQIQNQALVKLRDMIRDNEEAEDETEESD